MSTEATETTTLAALSRLLDLLGRAPLRLADELLRITSAGAAPPAAVDAAAIRAAAALVVWAQQQGHVCVDIQQVPRLLEASGVDVGELDRSTVERAIAAALDRSPWLVRTVVDGEHPDVAGMIDEPLVRHSWLLYSQRQYTDERTIVERLRRFAAEPPSTSMTVETTIADGLATAQLRAVETALSRRLTVITGGPGTGKTFTIARIVDALRAAARDVPPVIAVAAPTGKAAARVGASLGDIETSTIHRLLGPTGSSTRFRHDEHTPLPHDVVIIDETSMVSLQLMARLLEALRPDARLILVGDPDQLESVESGSVLQDVVIAAADPGSPLAPCVLELDQGFRATDAVARAAAIVRSVGRDRTHASSATDDLISHLNGSEHLTWIETDDPLAVFAAAAEAIVDNGRAAVDLAEAGSGTEALERIDTRRVLCGHRTGPWGAAWWNERVRNAVHGNDPARRRAEFPPGLPLLVTANDPATDLVNGDTGVVVRVEGGATVVFAEHPHGIDPYHLPEHEAAYAMTIHKSQGSEYEHVVVVLPPEHSPLLTRELLYTAITRAKRSLTIVGSREALTTALHHESVRASGLRAALGP